MSDLLGFDAEDRHPDCEQIAPECVERRLRSASTQLGAEMWEEAATPFLRWLQSRRDDYGGVRVLELGAGTGLVGLALASDGAVVTITDMEALLPLLELNAADSGGLVTATGLQWDQASTMSTDFDLVVGCEIVYSLASQSELIYALQHFVTSTTECCLVVNLRNGGGFFPGFLEALDQRGFLCETEMMEGDANPLAFLSITSASADVVDNVEVDCGRFSPANSPASA